MVSDAERRKIPIMIKKDLLDVEGFQADAEKCWKYVMIIAFLATELLILNRDTRYDNVKRILKIIQKSLSIMRKKNMPRILKTIYIHTAYKKPKQTCEELLNEFNCDKTVFDNIKFEYIYIPLIPVYELEDYSFNLIEHPAYKKYLNEVIDKISKTKNYNSVGSLIDYIDTFNETVNGNSGFNKQTIIQDLELDFNGIYNRHENKLKNILTNKIPTLKPVERLDETFEEFIQKQEKLKFEFTINNDEFTFYGACPDFDDRYNNLRNEKTFKIDPKEIFLEVYNTQIVSLQIQEEKRMQEEKARKEAEERAKAREERRKKEEEEEKQRQELRRKQEEERRKKEEEEERQRQELRRKQEEERRKKEEEEEKQRQEQRRREEEERRKKEEEEERQRQELRRKQEEERRKREEEEERQRQELRRKQEEERRRKEEEEERQRQELRRKQEEERRKKEEEEEKLREEQRRREEEIRRKEEERLKKEHEERMRQIEEDQRRQQQEAFRKAEEERRRLLEEQRRKEQEEERQRQELRRRQEEERRKREEDEERQRQEQRRREEEARRKRQEDEERQRQEQRRREEEARRRREQEEEQQRQEQRRREEEARRRRQEEEERQRQEQRRKEEEERRQRQEQEERQRLERRQKEEEERKKRLEEEERQIQEQKRKEEEEERRKEEERKKREEEEKKKIQEKEQILEFFVQKKRDINNYFAKLKFREKIVIDSFEIKIQFTDSEFLIQQVEDFKKFIGEKIKQKKKEWDDQVERAKWKTIVQAHGEMKCKNGHDLKGDLCCVDCSSPVYWADSDEHYVICKGCKDNLKKISGKIICDACGAESLCTVKWISGYKP